MEQQGVELERMEEKYSKRENSISKMLLLCAVHISSKNTLALLASRFFFLDFSLLSGDLLFMSPLYVCMYVNMLLRMCNMIAWVKKNLDIVGGR